MVIPVSTVSVVFSHLAEGVEPNHHWFFLALQHFTSKKPFDFGVSPG